MRYLLFLFFTFFYSHNILAQQEYRDEEFYYPTIKKVVEDFKSEEITDNSKILPINFRPLKITPSRFFSADLSMPSEFSLSNNLVKKVGSFYRAFGEIIVLQGKVTDSFRIPVSGAVIEIWQTNAAGKYHTLLEDGSGYIDKYFNMSGKSITDNMGNFYFITIMPGETAGRAPHINTNIYHEKFGKLETEIYFQGHPYNIKDYQYLAYEDWERELLTAPVKHSNIIDSQSIKVFTFNVVLDGVHDYKTF
ncbi:MAG: hypothetical protein CMP18_00980 [Rickettsiales bacterium]|jgi:protocatechuate 3,4-dioxygenase, beta subunit|nr:hypothetical protein [Rickettsiales bacterium]|tara:strand:- start:752 stop:1498 length:747 start_codon:yes stop_codon:yes gene_type:complete